ncbi:HEAT repeat domain-containing protein [Pedobacter metabolipauper]|nr:HEAT repeat domain-containing protein [Pedobacter metabolipauper]
MNILSSRLSLMIALLLSAGVAGAQDIQKPGVNSPTSFAIVVDQNTYSQAKKEIDSYKNAVEKDGLGTYIISSNWKNPEEIRSVLKKLYNQKQSLEGAVLVGDIPIAMIRDAQYLTSTFKMNQKVNWQRSSVPSDRFYDDFQLEFDFIKQDTARKDYFYYSISPAGSQKINMSIYSARIKPPVIAGKDKYQLIREYLNKVVIEKSRENKINDVFISTSHGYNSESSNAWAGEQLAFKGQFPDLFRPGNQVKFFSFLNETFLKFNLLSALKSKDLDIAIMHGHGDTDIQLVNGYPYVSNPQGSIENLTRYLRAKVRDAKDAKRDVEKVKEGFVKSLGVSMGWMDNAFDPKVIEADSIFNDDLDIHVKDILSAKPNARFVMLDNCLTGSFHLDEYLAGYYPFSGGNNIVAIANSIGVLQDLWPDQLMGILQHGSRVGNWFKHTAYLESHIMGDPTFSFTANTDFDVNKAITGKNSVAYWKTLLSKPDADLQALSLVYLARLLDSKALSALLKKTYLNSPYETTRMQAFQLLERLDNADYQEILISATKDPYEFIRRNAVNEISERGGKEFIPALINMVVDDYHSERIGYKIRTTLPFMDAETSKKQLEDQVNADRLVHFEKSKADLLKLVNYSEVKVKGIIDTILDKSKADKVRLYDIMTMRAYRYHQTIPALIQTVKDQTNSDAIRIAALEVLSWFPRSYKKQEIIALCKEIEQGESYNQELKKQAKKNIGIFL